MDATIIITIERIIHPQAVTNAKLEKISSMNSPPSTVTKKVMNVISGLNSRLIADRISGDIPIMPLMDIIGIKVPPDSNP